MLRIGGLESAREREDAVSELRKGFEVGAH